MPTDSENITDILARVTALPAQITAIVAGATNISVNSPGTPTTIDIDRKTTYSLVTNSQIPMVKTGGEAWPTTLTDGAIAFTAKVNSQGLKDGIAAGTTFTGSVTISQATGDAQAFYLELTSTQTDVDTTVGGYDFDFVWVASTGNPAARRCLRKGTLTVRDHPNV